MLQLASVPRLYLPRLAAASFLVYTSIYVYTLRFTSSIAEYCPSNSTTDAHAANANNKMSCLSKRPEIARHSLMQNSGKRLEANSYKATTNPPPPDVAILLDNANICRRPTPLKYLFYVHSAPENADRRELLRTTWLELARTDERRNVAWIFLLGRSEDPAVNEQVKAEAISRRDIVQGDFVDDYKNLTLKAVMGLKWIAAHCSLVRFAIKADDDTFVNTIALLNALKLYEADRKLLLCSVWNEGQMPILRNRSSCLKWCVEEGQFPGRRFYPRYCAGLAFVMSGDLVPLLYERSKATPSFWIDDVYVTGLLPLGLREVQYVPIVKRTYLRDTVLKDLLSRHIPFTYLFLHLPDKDEYSHVWKLFSELNKNMTLYTTDIMI